MRSRNPVAVGRNDSRQDFMKVMTEGKEKLENGSSIVIFPQSTRTLEMIPEKFNSLGIKLAQKAGAKIVPMAIKTDFWENGKLIKDLGVNHRDRPVFIKFGEPMTIKGNGKEEHQFVVEFIKSNLEEWRNLKN